MATVFMASTSSGSAAAIRISDGEEGTWAKAWTSWGLDGASDNDEGAEAAGAALARARDCDVYVGHGGGVRRMVAWLRAELELLGVPCVASDRSRCVDAPSHAAARAAMDAAAAGVVFVTPVSLGNPYAVEEIRVLADRGVLVPVLVGLGRGDLVAADVVERRGGLWGTHGGHLWKAYDGAEDEWRQAVTELARAEPAVVVSPGDGEVRDRVLDVLHVLGARLGRRAVVAAVRGWRAPADPELPFLRNPGFVGRDKELLDLLGMLRGPARQAAAKTKAPPLRLDEELALAAVDSYGPFIDRVVCITGASGAGKTELALEFAHRHAHEYKRVLWVHGEPRYLRQSYLKLADHLGVAVGADVAEQSVRSLPDIEGDAIAKVRKELARDMPYLLVIDNLESDKDWWDGRDMHELLPRGNNGSTHVVITTRLRLQGVRMLELGKLGRAETMRLMKGTRGMFRVEDTALLRSIEDKVGGVTLGLALVGSILSELDVEPGEVHFAMSAAPHRAPTWGSRDDPALRDNPGLVQLLDASLALLDREELGLGAAVARLLEASSFFAPAAPIPAPALARAAAYSSEESSASVWKRLVRNLSCAASARASASSYADLEVLVRLGFARRCARAGHVSVHGVLRLFGRKVGGSGHGQVARKVVRAVTAGDGGIAEEHEWAACLSLFRFEGPAAAVELPAFELARFIARAALPLAVRAVDTYSVYSAALELLREATDAVRAAEDRYAIGASGGMDLDPKAYHELAQTRAELLVMRARMMVRAGEYGIAEDHCLTAIDILEVVCGDDHVETRAVREFLERAVNPHRNRSA